MNINKLKDQIYNPHNPQQQYNAAYKMRFVKNNPEIINILFKACYDARDPNLQQEAVRSLSVLKPEKALKVFIEKSTNNDESIRLKSFYHLGTLGNPKGIDAVLKGLMDNKSHIRRAAAISAGRIGKDQKAISALKQIVNPFESQQIRQEAEKSIINIKKRINISKNKIKQNISKKQNNRTFNKITEDRYQSYSPMAF